MSNSVFPTFPGLMPGVTRTPVWSTHVKTSVSMREYRVANAAYPIYRYKLSFEFLRQTTGFTEMATLVAFFNARSGSFDSFLWTDPDDNSVTAQSFGAGDGSTISFQLTRTFGGYAEPVFDTNSTPAISVNGVLKTAGTDYTISSTGVVTFAAAPGSTLPLTWTGTYYRRVRFASDSAEFAQFLKNLWELKAVELIGVNP